MQAHKDGLDGSCVLHTNYTPVKHLDPKTVGEMHTWLGCINGCQPNQIVHMGAETTPQVLQTLHMQGDKGWWVGKS